MSFANLVAEIRCELLNEKALSTEELCNQECVTFMLNFIVS